VKRGLKNTRSSGGGCTVGSAGQKKHFPRMEGLYNLGMKLTDQPHGAF
jgi:hypothetical protein